MEPDDEPYSGSLEEAVRWIQYARDDLEAAELLLSSPLSPPRLGAFHAQQAAEKATEAVLVAVGRTSPSTHDLVRLLEIVPPTWSVHGLEVERAALSRYAVDARYSDDLPDVSADEAETAVADAERVLEAVAADLAPLLGLEG